MAGYDGWSMSNNAVEAYESGEMPLSKWTKASILEVVEKHITDEQIFTALEKAPVAVLKDRFLYRSSWHHTSMHFNKTDFYAIDAGALDGLTVDRIEAWVDDYKQYRQEQREEVKEPEVRRARCEYLEWSGSRKHPKATEHVAVGEIKGNWFYPDGESFKKSIDANGFRILEDHMETKAPEKGMSLGDEAKDAKGASQALGDDGIHVPASRQER